MILGIVALLQPLKLRSQTLKLDLPMIVGAAALLPTARSGRMRRMKPLGFSLEEMAELLRAVESDEADAGEVPATEEVLDSFIAQAQERREALRVQLGMADKWSG